jgi:hypothetical protein
MKHYHHRIDEPEDYILGILILVVTAAILMPPALWLGAKWFQYWLGNL